MKKAKGDGGGAGTSPFRATGGESIPDKYNDPETSKLSLTVTGGNQTHDIKLD